MIRRSHAVVLMLVVGAAWAQEDLVSVYRPAQEASQPAEASAAEKEIRRIADRGDYHEHFGVSKADFGGNDTMFPVAEVKFEKSALVLVLERANPLDEEPQPVRIAYSALGAAEVVERTYIRQWTGVRLSAQAVLWHKPGGSGPERARRLADALFALYVAREEEPRQEADFAAVVASYRAASPKPFLSEEARKYKVQAEFMVKRKQFAEAARLYGSALGVAPWWPEGHFNRALILGELKQMPGAIREMRRYLELVPDAPDARAAQDKIYEWEALAPKAK